MIKTLTKRPKVAKVLPYAPCAVIIGKTGVGKTTLVNNLCGANHEAGAGDGSVTRQLFRNNVNCGEYAFSLIDTPGMDSSSEAYKHAYLLRQALTATAVNTVFVVMTYDTRFNRMVENYLEVEQPIYKYARKIVVMISHWDLSKQPETEFQKICQIFDDNCPELMNIICYSEQCSPIQIAQLMYDNICNMEPEKIQITDDEFMMKFSVAEIKIRIKKSLDEYLTKAKALLNEYSEAVVFVKSQCGDDQDEVLHMLIVEFKNELEISLNQFREKHGGSMQELDFYTFYIKMEKENVKLCDTFVENVVSLMSYNLFDSGDPRNLIKKCPYCGLIWFKTEGCDGSTTCGRKSFDNYFDLSKKVFSKYELKRVDGKLRWIKNPIQKVSITKTADASKGVGCGQTLVWRNLPKLEDDLILELFKVKTIEQAKQIIQASNFKEARQKYESNIDTKFYD